MSPIQTLSLSAQPRNQEKSQEIPTRWQHRPRLPASFPSSPGRHTSPTPGPSPPSSHRLLQTLQEKALQGEWQAWGCQRKSLGPSPEAALSVMHRAFGGSPLWAVSLKGHPIFPFLSPTFFYLLLPNSHLHAVRP